MISLLLAALACDDGATPPAAPLSRVDAVAAAPAAPVDLDEFCEARPSPEAAPAFAWPPVHGEAPPTTGRWTWVNVWATWCAPCLAEMPTIVKWPDKLAGKGAAIDLRLLSVDEDAAVLAAFTKGHAEVAGSLHMVDGAQATAWVQGMGLEVNPVLPLHVLVDPQGRTRCVRSGALDHAHIQAIEAVVKGG